MYSLNTDNTNMKTLNTDKPNMDKLSEYTTLTCLFDEIDQIKAILEKQLHRLHDAMEFSISYNAQGLRDEGLTAYLTSIRNKNESPKQYILPHFADVRLNVEIGFTEDEGE
jgi:hypothetical protein